MTDVRRVRAVLAQQRRSHARVPPFSQAPARLEREFAAVRRSFGTEVLTFLAHGARGASWADYGVIANVDHRRIIGRFHADHPYRPPRFTIDPPVRSKHYYDDGHGMHLCFCRPEEWNPDWTIATALGIVYRFLGLTRQRKVD